MVAYQGDVHFAFEGSGGMGKFLKKTFTGEGMSLMKVSGSGDVFLARTPTRSSSCTWRTSRSPSTASTCWPSRARLTWDIKRVEGASMASGGLFNTTFTGTGVLAITVHGTPVVLNVDVPTFVDVTARSAGRPPCSRRAADRQGGARSSAVVPARPTSWRSPGTGSSSCRPPRVIACRPRTADTAAASRSRAARCHREHRAVRAQRRPDGRVPSCDHAAAARADDAQLSDPPTPRPEPLAGQDLQGPGRSRRRDCGRPGCAPSPCHARSAEGWPWPGRPTDRRARPCGPTVTPRWPRRWTS